MVMARTKQTKHRGKKVQNGEQLKLQNDPTKTGAIGANGQSNAAGEQQVQALDGAKSHREAKQDTRAEARRTLEDRKLRKAELKNMPENISEPEWVIRERVERRVRALKQAIKAGETTFKMPENASPGNWSQKSRIWSKAKEKWAVRKAEPGGGMQKNEVDGIKATVNVKQQHSDGMRGEKAAGPEATARVEQQQSDGMEKEKASGNRGTACVKQRDKPRFLSKKEKTLLRRIRLRTTRNPKDALAIDLRGRSKLGRNITTKSTGPAAATSKQYIGAEPTIASEHSAVLKKVVASEPANACEDQEMEWEGCGD